MSSLGDTLLSLAKQLYPTGRAWKMPFGGVLEGLHKALNISEEQAYLDAVSIHDSILPDNANFTALDATDWEGRLGLIVNQSTPLADRKLAIIRKMNQPGIARAKGNWRHVQAQLQAAGFNVYVYENRFDSYPYGNYETLTPYELSGDTGFINFNRYGQFNYGQRSYGGKYTKFVANYIDEATDWKFDIGTNLRSTFYIGNNPVGTFANIPLSRKDEFRQLILTLKPQSTVAFLFINYV